MSGLPVFLHGDTLEALVVGGGEVAERKVRSLVESGAAVRVVAPRVADGIRAMAQGARVSISQRTYETADIGNALLVIAAADAGVNELVARDALAARRVIIRTDDASAGNCSSMAVHRAGELVIAVSAARVPGAAARIRDAIAREFGEDYSRIVRELADLRQRLIATEGAPAWRTASADLLAGDFRAAVESGEMTERLERWR